MTPSPVPSSADGPTQQRAAELAAAEVLAGYPERQSPVLRRLAREVLASRGEGRWYIDRELASLPVEPTP